jgi:2-polyprenyl-3-methyl-5-hydroxy-6-metoxy-1,4-benzoquinol methylase
LAVAKENGWKTVGVEPSDKARAIALKKAVSLSKTPLGIRKSLFDVITMWHVLEHVPLYEQIKELKRLLKPSGTLVAVLILNPSLKHYGTFWA